MEELVDQVTIKYTFLIHLTDFGAERLVGKLPHVIAKQNFIVSKRDQRLGWRSDLGGSLGHRDDPFERLSAKLKIVSPRKVQGRLSLASSTADFSGFKGKIHSFSVLRLESWSFNNFFLVLQKDCVTLRELRRNILARQEDVSICLLHMKPAVTKNPRRLTGLNTVTMPCFKNSPGI
jgi:hypothetical protein